MWSQGPCVLAKQAQLKKHKWDPPALFIAPATSAQAEKKSSPASYQTSTCEYGDDELSWCLLLGRSPRTEGELCMNFCI